MACAVMAPMAAMPSGRVGCFSGDQENLVDLLILASAQKSSDHGSSYAGWGRELQAFVFEDVEELPVKELNSRNKMARPHGSSKAKSTNKKAEHKVPRTLAASSPSSSAELRALQFTQSTSATTKPRGAAAPTPVACPGFNASPKPQTLPRPTGMLQRAALAKARAASLGAAA